MSISEDSPFKYWDSKGKDENGLHTFELEPPLEVLEPKEISLDVVYRACSCLQVDADKVLHSDEPIELPDHPPLNHYQDFFDIMVKNSEDYNISEMPTPQLKRLIALITSYFTIACSQE